MTAEAAWDLRYKDMKEFVEEKVHFDQYKERLGDHRKQSMANVLRAASD